MNAVENEAGGHPDARLLAWLADHHVEYELHEHPVTYSAGATAVAEGIDPRWFAKVVGVRADDRRTLLVVDANDRVDLAKARRVLKASHVRLLTEVEMAAIDPADDLGTVAPIGELYGLEVVADYAVRDDPMIAFHAGSHRFAARVDRAQWERAAGITYADLAQEVPSSPAWAHG